MFTDISEIKPNIKRFVIIIFAIMFLIIIVYALGTTVPKETEHKNKKLVTNLFTDVDTHELGLENLSAQVKLSQQDNEKLRKEIASLKQELQQVKNNVKTNTNSNNSMLAISSLNERLSMLEKQELDLYGSDEVKQEKILHQDTNFSTTTDMTNVTDMNTNDDKYVGQLYKEKGITSNNGVVVLRTIKNKENYKSQVQLSSNIGSDNNSNLQNGSPNSLKNISSDLDSLKSSYEKNISKESNTSKQILNYIPQGSILSGMFVTGLDAPTKQEAKHEPVPVLINLDKNAILPNEYDYDLKECFVLAAGYGDMSSERVYLRTEGLSCVTENGEVFETKINGYIVGEDGKAGVRGRLVSKQGKLIARSLMAGFLEGMSGAFDVNPVPILNTSASGSSIQYQRTYNSMALEGAAVEGTSKALDRIASFYLKLAQEMFPVLEIDAARQVDIVLTSGFSLELNNKK